MNGHFEVDNSAYPIGYLMAGGGLYQVTDMRYLSALHSYPIHKEKAIKVAASANKLIRDKKLSLADGSTGVREFVQQEVAE